MQEMLQKIAVIAVWRKQKPTCCEIARIDYQRITRFSERKTYANLLISSQLLHDTSFFSNFASDFRKGFYLLFKIRHIINKYNRIEYEKVCIRHFNFGNRFACIGVLWAVQQTD